MRPPSQRQDPVRSPLNEILGSEGNVRILRVLAGTNAAIGRTMVARLAQLNPSGVRRSLDRLAALGLVEIAGSGRNQIVRLRDRHPLGGALRSLFRCEQGFFEEIRRVAGSIAADPSFPGWAIWIEDPDTPSPGTLDIGVLGPASGIDNAVRSVEDRCRELEPGLAVHFVIHGYTDADLPAGNREQTERLEQVTLLAGWIPLSWRRAGRGPIRSHRDLDDRALELGRRVADQLPNDRSILERALVWIEKQLQGEAHPEVSELDEWKRILKDLSVSQIQALLREESERATRLRQSFPFFEALSSPGWGIMRPERSS
jgi:DNA-binding transcriptional ArsR family regulator